MKKLFVLVALFMALGLGSCVLGLDIDSSGTVDWGKVATEWRGENGKRVSMTFPAGGTSGSIWGTDMYTDDSCIGTAAVHCGLITFQAGGSVTIEIHPGQTSYNGSIRNGVESDSYGSWGGSFTFVE